MTAQELVVQKHAMYLGDGVYIFVDAFGDLNLVTSDGIQVTNRIVLEPEVLKAMDAYLKATIFTTKTDPAPPDAVPPDPA